MRIERVGDDVSLAYAVVDDSGHSILYFDSLNEAYEAMYRMQEEEMEKARNLNTTPVKSYLDYQWKTKDKEILTVREMSRGHVQNTLQWCIRKQASPDDEKDNVRYSNWIAYFTARLLDPELGE